MIYLSLGLSVSLSLFSFLNFLVQEMTKCPPPPSRLPPPQEGRRDCGPLEDDKTAHENTCLRRSPAKTKELDAMVLEAPGKGEGIQVEI